MSKLVINDLPKNIELDRAVMKAVHGGDGVGHWNGVRIVDGLSDGDYFFPSRFTIDSRPEIGSF